MANTDLSAALGLIQERTDVKYSNIGNIVKELTDMGFDPKTAKMAVMMVFQDGPEVQYLKSSAVSPLQAAKAMFAANIDLGQILDSLIEMGYTREDASHAVDLLNTDEGSQEVNQFSDVNEGEDNAFADYADPGYEYDDVPPEAIKEIVEIAKQNRDLITPESIRATLENFNVSSQSINQLTNELFGKTSALRRVVIDDPEEPEPQKKQNPKNDAPVKDFEDEINETWTNPEGEWEEYGGREGVYKEHITLPFHSPANAYARNLPPNFAPVRSVAHSLGFGDIKRAIDEFQYVRDMHNPLWQDWLDDMKDEIKKRLIENLGEERGQQEYDRLAEYALGRKKRKMVVAPVNKTHPNYRKDRKPYTWDDPNFSLVPKQFFTSSVEKQSVDLSWREVGLSLQNHGVPQDQIINILKQQGATDEEAHAASLPQESASAEGPEGPGAPSDAPEDLDMGPSDDFPYGAGMDMDGPGGLNDGLEGAPGPNDFDATGGGYMGAPEDTEDGSFFTEGQDSGQAPEPLAEEGQDVDYWGERAQDYVASDPQMTRTDLLQILQNQGASEEEANQVAENLELEDDPAIRPGTIVRAGGTTGEVTGMWDTLYGKMASVKLENGGEYEFAIEDIEKIKQDKLATTRDELLDKIAAHLSGDWYDALEALPTDYRNTYSERIKAATKLQREVHNRISTTKDVGEMGLLGEAKVALANEIVFCQTRLASADFVGEEDYVNSLPKYEFGKEASGGYAFGPGGGESIVLIAAEMEEELEGTNWNEFARIASVEFVSEVSPMLVGDAQEVARLATGYIQPKVAMLSAERAQEVADEFLANVEKVRRSMASAVRTAGIEKEAEKYPWDECIADQKAKGYSQERAEKICGSIKAKNASVNDFPAPDDEEGWAQIEKQAAFEDDDVFIGRIENLIEEYKMAVESKDFGKQQFIERNAEDLINANPDKPQLEEIWNNFVTNYRGYSEGENPSDDPMRFATSQLFETIEDLNDMQEEVEEDEEENKNEKKSNTEISDEGWLL